MPGTSSTSFVKHWPKPDRVLADLRKWTESQTAIRPELIALGYFGSHARGDTGFGSDLAMSELPEPAPAANVVGAGVESHPPATRSMRHPTMSRPPCHRLPLDGLIQPWVDS